MLVEFEIPYIQKTKSWDKVLHHGWNYVPLTTESIKEIDGKFLQIDKDILDKEYSGWSKRFEEILVKKLLQLEPQSV